MKKKNSKIAMIILAAGESKRMGTIKQLLPWKNTTLLGNLIEQGLASNVEKVFVVLGANYKNIIKKVETDNIEIIYNKNWSLGMGFSISFAMHYIDKKALCFDAVLIALVDQPLIDVVYFNKLTNSFISDDYEIVASKYNERVGVPAIISSKYFDLLSKLESDFGARKIIKENIDDLKVVNEEDNLIDIDTISDYKSLFHRHGKI